jgi:hypothetical protein
MVTGVGWIGSWLFVVAAAMALTALRMFEPSEKEAKIGSVHLFPNRATIAPVTGAEVTNPLAS